MAAYARRATTRHPGTEFRARSNFPDGRNIGAPSQFSFDPLSVEGTPYEAIRSFFGYGLPSIQFGCIRTKQCGRSRDSETGGKFCL
jgi:hypothetical protein